MANEHPEPHPGASLALGVLGVIIPAPDVLSHPGIWPLMIVSCAMVVALAVLTFTPRIDSPIRAWGFLLIGLGLAIMTLGMFGLSGSGRVILCWRCQSSR